MKPITPFFLVLVLFAFVALNSSLAYDAKTPKGEKYLIITKHTKEQCLSGLDAIMSKDKTLLEKTVWGCMSGVHEGWTTLEAQSEADARGMLPVEMQKEARIVKVGKFTPEQIESYHKH